MEVVRGVSTHLSSFVSQLFKNQELYLKPPLVFTRWRSWIFTSTSTLHKTSLFHFSPNKPNSVLMCASLFFHCLFTLMVNLNNKYSALRLFALAPGVAKSHCLFAEKSYHHFPPTTSPPTLLHLAGLGLFFRARTVAEGGRTPRPVMVLCVHSEVQHRPWLRHDQHTHTHLLHNVYVCVRACVGVCECVLVDINGLNVLQYTLRNNSSSLFLHVFEWHHSLSWTSNRWCWYAVASQIS